MTEPITLEQIATAYDAVRESFEGYCRFREAVGELIFGTQDARRDDRSVRPDGALVCAIESAFEEMRRRYSRAEEAMTTAVRWHLRVLEGPVVGHLHHRAESYADLVQVLVRYTVDHAWTGEDLRACPDRVWNQLTHCISGYPVDVAEFPPSLNKERARLEERLIGSGDSTPYGDVRAALSKQNRKLFDLLLAHIGEVVEGLTIAEALWKDPYKAANHINVAAHRLREALVEMGMATLKKRVKTVPGGLRLERAK